MRYKAVITVTVEYDADDEIDARGVASKLGNTISIPTPLGRSSELVRISESVKVKA